MRLSVWQQFSSNHSARFTVVGQFETAEAARKAAEELNQILTTITNWYEDPANADALAELEGGDELPVSPPEIQLSQQYNVEWSEHGLDWIWGDQEERVVTVADRLVFVTSGDTWLGAKPMDSLVQRLGGTAMVDGHFTPGEGGDYAKVTVDLTCLALDADTAEAITSAVNSYFEAIKSDSDEPFNTPWRSYSQRQEYSTMRGQVTRDGLRIHFEQVSFFHIGYGLPGLIAYLQDKGCTNIEYRLQETRDD
jgi:hypothetical protein